MNDVEKILNDYYSNYDEDSRLVKDKAHHIEYITTTKYIEKYLKDGDRILEVGAGTGRYSINYASKGYMVDSVELLDKNLDILKSKITKGMNINAIKGNYKVGNSENFIIEACEYVESFLKFSPKAEIILNIDNDHLDYFKTFENIKKAFIFKAFHYLQNSSKFE